MENRIYKSEQDIKDLSDKLKQLNQSREELLRIELDSMDDEFVDEKKKEFLIYASGLLSDINNSIYNNHNKTKQKIVNYLKDINRKIIYHITKNVRDSLPPEIISIEFTGNINQVPVLFGNVINYNSSFLRYIQKFFNEFLGPQVDMLITNGIILDLEYIKKKIENIITNKGQYESIQIYDYMKYVSREIENMDPYSIEDLDEEEEEIEEALQNVDFILEQLDPGTSPTFNYEDHVIEYIKSKEDYLGTDSGVESGAEEY